VVNILNAAFPGVEFTNWQHCARLTPHVQAVRLRLQSANITMGLVSRLYNQAGVYLNSQNRVSEALPLFEEALSIYRESLPSNHPDIASSLNNLAVLYQAQNLLSEAQPLFEEALSIRRDVLPARHPDIAQSLNNLAALYQAQGLYDMAQPLYEEALAIHRESLPSNHPDIASSLNNLADLYQAQNLLSEAQPLFEERYRFIVNRCLQTSGHSDQPVQSGRSISSTGFVRQGSTTV